jgi:hypothetical protein
MIKLIQGLGVVFLLIYMSACQPKTNSKTIVIDNIAINAEGPLYEGANLSQGEVQNALNAFAKENGITVDAVKSVQLKSLTISTTDSNSLDAFTSLNLQFASDQTAMVQAAAVNKIEPGTKSINATIASQQEGLLELLKQDKFILVVDATVAKDTSMNINLQGKMEIEIKY